MKYVVASVKYGNPESLMIVVHEAETALDAIFENVSFRTCISKDGIIEKMKKAGMRPYFLSDVKEWLKNEAGFYVSAVGEEVLR